MGLFGKKKKEKQLDHTGKELDGDYLELHFDLQEKMLEYLLYIDENRCNNMEEVREELFQTLKNVLRDYYKKSGDGLYDGSAYGYAVNAAAQQLDIEAERRAKIKINMNFDGRNSDEIVRCDECGQVTIKINTITNHHTNEKYKVQETFFEESPIKDTDEIVKLKEKNAKLEFKLMRMKRDGEITKKWIDHEIEKQLIKEEETKETTREKQQTRNERGIEIGSGDICSICGEYIEKIPNQEDKDIYGCPNMRNHYKYKEKSDDSKSTNSKKVVRGYDIRYDSNGKIIKTGKE